MIEPDGGPLSGIVHVGDEGRTTQVLPYEVIERGLRAVLDELRIKSLDGRMVDVNYPLSNLPRLVDIFRKAAEPKDG